MLHKICLLIYALVFASSFLPTEQMVKSKVKDIKRVELDINGNGKSDYFREFDPAGFLRFIRYDYNEDAKFEYEIELNEQGFKIREVVDRNYDGKIDYQLKCESMVCHVAKDDDFDGIFEVKSTTEPQRFKQMRKSVDEVEVFRSYRNML